MILLDKSGSVLSQLEEQILIYAMNGHNLEEPKKSQIRQKKTLDLHVQ